MRTECKNKINTEYKYSTMRTECKIRLHRIPVFHNADRIYMFKNTINTEYKYSTLRTEYKCSRTRSTQNTSIPQCGQNVRTRSTQNTSIPHCGQNINVQEHDQHRIQVFHNVDWMIQSPAIDSGGLDHSVYPQCGQNVRTRSTQNTCIPQCGQNIHVSEHVNTKYLYSTMRTECKNTINTEYLYSIMRTECQNTINTEYLYSIMRTEYTCIRTPSIQNTSTPQCGQNVRIRTREILVFHNAGS